jgi:3-oxoacyl-[acyl-carrier-protein] synthase-1
VVGLGCATAIGETAEATAAAVRAGISGFSEHPFMINKKAEPYIVGTAPYLDSTLSLEQRIEALLLAAAGEALGQLSDRMTLGMTVSAIIGGPSPRPGLPTDLGSRLPEFIQSSIHGLRLASARYLPNGHSAGLMAVEEACKPGAMRPGGFCVVGGVDSYINFESMDWLESFGQIHGPGNAWGFIPGEAAGCCLLCDEETADRYELPILARIAMAATTTEPNRIKTKSICIGTGLTEVFRRVLPSLPADTRVDCTICDQNGESYRADEYGFSVIRTNKYFRDASDFVSPADCWGDVGAASGPLFILLATIAAQKGYGRGPWTLVWTSSEGGERSAALIHTDMNVRRFA